MLRSPTGAAKFAETDRSPLMVTVQLVFVPEHAPDQPVKFALLNADAISVTLEPSA
jgi:hypothetical protein